jgi:hypothetical protein
LIGMLTSPKLMAPLHMARGMLEVCPDAVPLCHTTSTRTIGFTPSG